MSATATAARLLGSFILCRPSDDVMYKTMSRVGQRVKRAFLTLVLGSCELRNARHWDGTVMAFAKHLQREPKAEAPSFLNDESNRRWGRPLGSLLWGVDLGASNLQEPSNAVAAFGSLGKSRQGLPGSHRSRLPSLAAEPARLDPGW